MAMLPDANGPANGSANSAANGSAIAARLAAMMFLEFFVWGAWYVTAGNFVDAREWGEGVVGHVYSVGPIAAIVSPLFLGMVADRFFATQKVLATMHLLGAVLIALAPAAAAVSPTAFVAVLLLHMLCYMPTLGLTNTLAFRNIRDQERQFPVIRVFGTLGWIAANVVVSRVLEADTGELQFYVAAAAAAALGLYGFTLPHTPPPAAGERPRLGQLLGLDALPLLRDRAFLVFLVCSFLICVPLAAYYAWAQVFVLDAGFAHPAFTMSFGQWAEVAFMLAMPFFFARLGVKKMLAIGMLAWVLRYVLFAAAAPSGIAWAILAGIVLHGICYDFFFVTGQVWVDKKAPQAVRAQAQGLLVLVTQGLGMWIGAQVMAAVVTANKVAIPGEPAGTRDWQAIWTVPALAAAVVLASFLLLFRERPTAAAQPALGRTS